VRNKKTIIVTAEINTGHLKALQRVRKGTAEKMSFQTTAENLQERCKSNQSMHLASIRLSKQRSLFS